MVLATSMCRVSTCPALRTAVDSARSSVRLGAEEAGLEFSGEYGFTETEMFWPLSHMVLPKSKTLQCRDCHEPEGRLDWRALGYLGDPMKTGGE